MICPFCKAENVTSTLVLGVTSETLMSFPPGYYDARGNFVYSRDPNWYTTGYQCSRGHYFQVVRHEGEPDEVKLTGKLTYGPQHVPETTP